MLKPKFYRQKTIELVAALVELPAGSYTMTNIREELIDRGHANLAASVSPNTVQQCLERLGWHWNHGKGNGSIWTKPEPVPVPEQPPLLPVVVDAFGFGMALANLELGKSVARGGWNGKGMRVLMQRPDEFSKMSLPYLYLEYPTWHHMTPGARVPWLASQTDILAKDWFVVE
jgi:hypothetical protein